MSVLIVGSMALDTLETPSGSVRESLGGSATFASLAARLLAAPHPVAVVGEDFPKAHLRMLASLGIATDGIERRPGRTFRWHGRYEAGDLNTAITLATELNVFQEFHPQLSPALRQCTHVLLGNIDPELQLSVLDQLQDPRCVGVDSMNYWIQTKPKRLKQVIGRTQIVFLNEGEAQLLSGRSNVLDAMEAIAARPAQAVIVKRGEYGCACLFQRRLITLPSFLTAQVADPTGAGDAFAGGVMSVLASRRGPLSLSALHQAVKWGTVLASFAIERLGTDALRRLTLAQAKRRLQEFSRRLGF